MLPRLSFPRLCTHMIEQEWALTGTLAVVTTHQCVLSIPRSQEKAASET